MVTVGDAAGKLPDISNKSLKNFQTASMGGTVVIDGFKMGLNLKTMWDGYQIDEKNAHNGLAEKVKVG